MILKYIDEYFLFHNFNYNDEISLLRYFFQLCCYTHDVELKREIFEKVSPKSLQSGPLGHGNENLGR